MWKLPNHCLFPLHGVCLNPTSSRGKKHSTKPFYPSPKCRIGFNSHMNADFHSVFPTSPQVKGVPLLCSGIKVWYLLVMKEPIHKNWLKFPGGWLLTLPFPWLYFPSELAWCITVLIQLQKGANSLLMEVHKFPHVTRRGIFTRN